MFFDGLVSVIIPCFNNGGFAKEAIKTVLDQEYSNLELVVVDDCSTDDTLKILDSLAAKDNRVTVIASDSNLGAGGARNLALEKSVGQYVAFLDADDLWDASKLRIQIEFMKKGKFPISHTSYGLVSEYGNKCNGGVVASPILDLYRYMQTTEIGMSTAVVDRNIVGDFRLDLVRTRQDTKLWLDLLGKGFTSHGCKEELVNYRVRSGQISSNKFKMLYRTFVVFWSVKQFTSLTRLKLYFSYVFNAINKRF